MDNWKKTKGNIKLENFFLQKTAAKGHTEAIHDAEEIPKTMAGEMARLKKWESLKQKLRDATGVVNFVTNNESRTLCEYLIKSVFQPEHLFSRDKDIEDDEFGLNASSYLGAVSNPTVQGVKARQRFEDLLFGSREPMNRKSKAGSVRFARSFGCRSGSTTWPSATWPSAAGPETATYRLYRDVSKYRTI